MITQYEVPGYLVELTSKFSTGDESGVTRTNIYKEIHQFTEYTRQAVEKNNYALAGKCFGLADKLYTDGDTVVKNAIENIFVFSFSSFIPQDKVENLILKSFIPGKLYSLFLNQMNHGGC